MDVGGVVRKPPPVGGAHLAESGADRLDQLGNPEAVSDLDHLAAGDYDLPPHRQHAGHPRASRCSVVDHVHTAGVGYGGGERVQRPPTPSTSASVGEVELDVGGAC